MSLENPKPKTTQIEHMVLCLNNFEESIKFYNELLVYLGFKIILDKIYNTQHYISYNNGIFDLGFISPEPEFEGNDFKVFQVGLSHLALRVDSVEALNECAKICNNYDLKVENCGDTKVHHLEDFKTLRFNCPSGILVELITK